MFPPGSVGPHPRENSCSWPHYGWWGTEIKEWSSGPIVLPKIRFRFHSYIQIILCSTAIRRVAIYQSHTHTHCQHDPTICQYLPTQSFKIWPWWSHYISCCLTSSLLCACFGLEYRRRTQNFYINTFNYITSMNSNTFVSSDEIWISHLHLWKK